MFQYRQVLVRLRAGDSVREIARSGLMGRDKLTELHALAAQHGWLDAACELPEDEALAAALGARKRVAASTVSSAEPHRTVIERWVGAGVQGRAIHAALKREHGYTGSYSAIVRIVRRLRKAQPPEVTGRTAVSSPPQWRSVVRLDKKVHAHVPHVGRGYSDAPWRKATGLSQ